MSPTKTLSPSAQKIQEALAVKGLELTVVELASSTRTAQDAANAIGCTVGQIIKSLVFRTVYGKKPILVLASGVNRVNEETIAKEVGEAVEKADAAYVLEFTGFAIGGVPPIGHKRPMAVLMDRELFGHDELWAAAGTPHAVFKLRAEDLERLVEGKKVSIT